MKTPSEHVSRIFLSVMRLIKERPRSAFRYVAFIWLVTLSHSHSQIVIPSGGSRSAFSAITSFAPPTGNTGTSGGGILPNAPTLGANNQGVNFFDAFVNNGYKNAMGNNAYSPFIPPDTHAAVGPNHMVTAVNGTLRIYEISSGSKVAEFRLGRLLESGNPSTAILDGNGNVVVPANTTSAFFAALSPATPLFDPRIVYDQFSGRFVVIALEKVDPPATVASRILIAASASSDPTGVWYYRAVDAKEAVTANGTTTQYWADYPTAAVDSEALYITVNMFNFNGDAFFGNRVWIINKSQLYASATAATATAVKYDPFALAGLLPAEVNSTAPAHVFGANGVLNAKGTYLVGWGTTGTGGQNRLSVIRVSAPLTSPTFTHRYVNLGNIHDEAKSDQLYFPDAPQLSDTATAHRIDTGDFRIQNAVVRFYANSASTTADDHWSLYLINTIVPRTAPSGQPANPDQGEATAHWYQIDATSFDTATNGLPVEQQANIGGEELGAGTHTFYPCIAVDPAGNIGIGLSACGANINAGAYYTGRKFAAAVNTMQPLGAFAEGTAGYFRPESTGLNRWGDYSSVTLDPDDESTFWIFNEFADSQGYANSNDATANGRWATNWGSFSVRDTTLKNDLNGDGFADLILQYYDTANTANPSNGRLAAWFMRTSRNPIFRDGNISRGR